ncbi:MAG: preprotein translocase subunit SecG [Bacteroidales bacterium]|jgi:preprotein translocase subunit SecG|nr:preprotein translocase subunit SecG [Bacteroidales bacterium]
MFVLVTVLIMIVALLLALVVLVQNGKGGGLAANFASQNQVMGVRKTTDFLEKATWTLAAVMVLLCLISSALTPKTVAQDSSKSGLDVNTKTTTTVPQTPTTPQNTTTMPVGK